MDEDGFLKIIGRTKEMIIVGGENVYPREIEEILHTHPNVTDVHVRNAPVCAMAGLLTGLLVRSSECLIHAKARKSAHG